MIKSILLITLAICFIETIEVSKPSSCTFPYLYKGKKYNDCIKHDSNRYWCSVYAVYNGTYSYCKTTDDGRITDEHFTKLMKIADEHAKQLKSLTKGNSISENTCAGCMKVLKRISMSVRELSAVFMDQNKRLQGLKSQHQALDKTVYEIKKYYQMRRCSQTDKGGDYLGKLSISLHGYKCQSWAGQKPHKHSFVQNDRYSDNNIKLAGSSCRNPDLSAMNWCYTTDKKVARDNCHIPKCNKDCKIDERDRSALPLCDAFQSSTCPKGAKFFNNKCYTVFTTPMTFNDAEKKCQSIKGHLVSVHSASENQYLTKTLLTKGSFFIGLNDQAKEGTYKFTDGSKKDYTRFYGGEPNNANNEDCIEVGRFPGMRDAWNDISCNTKRPFICKVSY